MTPLSRFGVNSLTVHYCTPCASTWNQHQICANVACRHHAAGTICRHHGPTRAQHIGPFRRVSAFPTFQHLKRWKSAHSAKGGRKQFARSTPPSPHTPRSDADALKRGGSRCGCGPQSQPDAATRSECAAGGAAWPRCAWARRGTRSGRSWRSRRPSPPRCRSPSRTSA